MTRAILVDPTIDELLALPDSERELLCEFVLQRRDTSELETFRFSESGFISNPSDTPTSTPYPARIVRGHEFSTSISERRLSGSGSVTFGPIEIIDRDDTLAALLTDYSWAGRIATMKLGQVGAPLAYYQPFSVRTIATHPSKNSNGNIVVRAEDFRRKFSKPSQQNEFAGFGSCLRLGDNTSADGADLNSDYTYNFADNIVARTVGFRIRRYGAGATAPLFILGKPRSWIFYVDSDYVLHFRHYPADGGNWRDFEFDDVVIENESADVLTWHSFVMVLAAEWDPTTGEPQLSLSDGSRYDGAITKTDSAAVAYTPDIPLKQGGSITGFDRGNFDLDELYILYRAKKDGQILADVNRPVDTDDWWMVGYWKNDEGVGLRAFPETHSPYIMDPSYTFGEGQIVRDQRLRMPTFWRRRDQNGHYYDGSNDILTVSHDAALDFAVVGEITIDPVFVLNGLPSVRTEIATLCYKGDSFRCIIDTSDRIVFSVWDGASWDDAVFTHHALVRGEQYFIIVAYDQVTGDATLQFPMESESIVQTINIGTLIQDSTDDMVMCARTAAADRLDGWWGPFRIYESAYIDLNDPRGSWAHQIDGRSPKWDQLRGDWRMGAITGTNIVDQKNGNDATFSGATDVTQHNVRFDLEANALWVGSGTGGDELRGKDRMQVEGECLQMDAILVDPIHHIYEINHRSVQSIDEVYVGGVLQIFDTDEQDLWRGNSMTAGHYETNILMGLIRLAAAPPDKVTCDVHGDNAGTHGFVDNAAAIAVKLADEQGGITDQVDATISDPIQAARPHQAHWFSKLQSPPLTSVMDFLAQSYFGHWGMARLGDFDLKMVPSEYNNLVADWEITDDDIDEITPLEPLPVAWKETVRYGRIGATISEEDLGSAISPKERTNFYLEWRFVDRDDPRILTNELDAVPVIIDTALDTQWDANAEITRRVSADFEPRQRFLLKLNWSPGTKLMFLRALPTDIVRVTSARHELSRGFFFVLAKLKEDYKLGMMAIEVWGGFLAPEDEALEILPIGFRPPVFGVPSLAVQPKDPDTIFGANMVHWVEGVGGTFDLSGSRVVKWFDMRDPAGGGTWEWAENTGTTSARPTFGTDLLGTGIDGVDFGNGGATELRFLDWQTVNTLDMSGNSFLFAYVWRRTPGQDISGKDGYMLRSSANGTTNLLSVRRASSSGEIWAGPFNTAQSRKSDSGYAMADADMKKLHVIMYMISDSVMYVFVGGPDQSGSLAYVGSTSLPPAFGTQLKDGWIGDAAPGATSDMKQHLGSVIEVDWGTGGPADVEGYDPGTDATPPDSLQCLYDYLKPRYEIGDS